MTAPVESPVRVEERAVIGGWSASPLESRLLIWLIAEAGKAQEKVNSTGENFSPFLRNRLQRNHIEFQNQRGYPRRDTRAHTGV